MPAQARAAWGWHRLTDEWARRLVVAAGIGSGDLVLDIGAGTGAITRALVVAGAHVYAFELHPGRCARLGERFGRDDVTILQVDAADMRLPRGPFRVVANPPFSITGPVLRRLMSPGSELVGADLVLQRSNARRWAAGEIRLPKGAAARFDMEVTMLVPRSALVPRPSVDVAVLTIRPRARPTPAGRRVGQPTQRGRRVR